MRNSKYRPKFRAWHKRERRYLTGDDPAWCISPDGRFSWWRGAGDIQVSTDCRIEEFTGLRDKHGREIYEGDIVKDDAEPRPFMVKWRISEFIIERKLHPTFGDSEIGWRMGSLSRSEGYDGDETVLDVEVIGTYHENPQLVDA